MYPFYVQYGYCAPLTMARKPLHAVLFDRLIPALPYRCMNRTVTSRAEPRSLLSRADAKSTDADNNLKRVPKLACKTILYYRMVNHFKGCQFGRFGNSVFAEIFLLTNWSCFKIFATIRAVDITLNRLQ